EVLSWKASGFGSHNGDRNHQTAFRPGSDTGKDSVSGISSRRARRRSREAEQAAPARCSRLEWEWSDRPNPTRAACRAHGHGPGLSRLVAWGPVTMYELLVENRNSYRYVAVQKTVYVGWWDEPEFRTIVGELRNLSHGGALVVAPVSPPDESVLWVCMSGAA